MTEGGGPEVGLDDELIVCTRNRPVDVARCLESVSRQERLPCTVRVVDSSDGDETETVVDGFAQGSLAGRLVYQRAAPGLTSQRNAGVAAGRSDVVHFVDDDVVLEPGYIAAVLSCFSSDPLGDVLGVGGHVTNVHHEPAPWSKRLFGLYGDEPGRVLASGRNVLPVDLRSEADVDWLSGCAMSYRRRVFEWERFDEGLPGYGLGEDVDFSYRVRQRGRLVVTPAARLEHLQSATNRLTTVRYTRDELVTRARRVRRGTGRLRMRAFWWSVAGQALALAVRAVTGPDRATCRGRLRVTVRTAGEIALEGATARPRLEPSTLT